MKEINVDEWFKGRIDADLSEDVYTQLAKNLARLQDVDIAMTPLVDLLTGYVKYRELQSKIDKAIEILNDGLKQLDERNRCEVYSEEYLENARDILKEDK